jgi:hypothetical protein
MGFPTWTLIGMGITFVGAFVMIVLAYIAQSPGFAARIGLGGTRIAYQVKLFTGYALALLLLFVGFFLAGVPLGVPVERQPQETAVSPESAAAVGDFPLVIPTSSGQTPSVTETPLSGALPAPQPTPDPDAPLTPAALTPAALTPAALTPASGAFGGPPAGEDAPPDESADNAAPSPPTATPAADSTLATSTPVTSTPTSTASPTATATPSPTVTPTPIDGETAVLNLGGGVIWLRRSPGGQNLIVLQDKEIVILHSGRANRAGVIWRQVATGNGTLGWVEEQFLRFNEN